MSPSSLFAFVFVFAFAFHSTPQLLLFLNPAACRQSEHAEHNERMNTGNLQAAAHIKSAGLGEEGRANEVLLTEA